MAQIKTGQVEQLIKQRCARGGGAPLPLPPLFSGTVGKRRASFSPLSSQGRALSLKKTINFWNLRHMKPGAFRYALRHWSPCSNQPKLPNSFKWDLLLYLSIPAFTVHVVIIFNTLSRPNEFSFAVSPCLSIIGGCNGELGRRLKPPPLRQIAVCLW